MNRYIKRLLVLLISLYKALVSPILGILLGRACRFSPTCSEYAIGAIYTHGVLMGSRLAIRRLLKCHPFSRNSFYDPVPNRTFLQ